MEQKQLSRRLGLVGLLATGICSMLGASIYVVPFMIQRQAPGIGPYVVPAFFLAALPALFAALAYGVLATSMPKAGGSYIYVSRVLHPFWGFVASFSQWFGLSIVIGVVAYVTIPFFRDMAFAMDWEETARFLELGLVRVGLALFLIWLFIWVNIRGAALYEKTIIPLMILMFVLGGILIASGFHFDHQDFSRALLEREGRGLPEPISADFDWLKLLGAASILFASFIGFDSIAQAGGEAKRPERNMPLAILLTIVLVGTYYMIFTKAVYHAVPWYFIAEEALGKDLTAPGLMGYLLSERWTFWILAGAAIALINDLPAMLLSVSRLLFAWSVDSIFPKKLSDLHPKFQTPVPALIISGIMASIGVLGSHFAGNFFLGIDIMVVAMMVNFLLVCLALFNIDQRNPDLVNKISFGKSEFFRKIIAGLGIISLVGFLAMHTYKDLQAVGAAWYYRSTLIWLMVMVIACLIFYLRWPKIKTNNSELFHKSAN